MKRLLMIVVVLGACVGIAAAQPSVAAFVNGASNLLPPLPNSGVAQGSIFIIYGSNMGPASLVKAGGTLPWPANLSGTTASVTVNGTTVNLPLYYTLATQVAGLLPSSTPVGTGTITVSYNNQNSVTAPITVVAHGVGIFTAVSNGTGPAILTDPVTSDPSKFVITSTNAANPGQLVDIWATGMGPVTGNDSTTPGPVQDMTASLGVKVWVGATSANVAYSGRSGCCIGEDQIRFTVPSGISGCSVPLTVQIGNFISNATTMPIATSGKTCTISNPAVPPSVLQTLLGKSQVSFGGVFLSRSISVGASLLPGFPATTTKSDDGSASFLKFSVNAAQAQSLVDTTPIGACLVTTFTSTNANPYASFTYTSLDAGAQITVNGPGGTQTLAKLTSGGITAYSAQFSNSASYLNAGNYTVTGPGGPDVGSFSVPLTIATPLVWTNQSAITTAGVTRASGVTVNWTGGDPSSTVTITGSSYQSTGTTTIVGASFTCQAPVSALTFTVPPPVLLALPPSGTIAGIPFPGTLGVSNGGAPVTFTATGLDYGYVQFTASNSISVTYN